MINLYGMYMTQYEAGQDAYYRGHPYDIKESLVWREGWKDAELNDKHIPSDDELEIYYDENN